MTELRPEPPDGTRIEFEHWTDVYGAWRDDDEGAKAGWATGDGERNWVVYGESVPWSWVDLAERFSVEALNSAVRLSVHPEDAWMIERWPTQLMVKGSSRPVKRGPTGN